MKKNLILPFLIVLILSACKKDTTTNCDKNMTSIAGTYSLVKMEVGFAGSFNDITSELDSCEVDDKVTLNANGASSYTDLGSVCSPTGDDSGLWSVSSSGKMTINTGGGILNVTDADITSFDCSTLVLTGFESGLPGSQFRLTIRK